MKNNKFLIISVITMVCLIIILIVLLWNRNVILNQDNNPTIEQPSINNPDYSNDYLIIDNTDIFTYKNNRFTKVTLVPNSKFVVYVNNQKIGNYYLEKSNVWNLFDENNNYVNYEGNILAFTNNNLNINVREVTVNEIDENDFEYIKQIININSINDLSLNSKIVVDLDHNGINDKIISVSNLDSDNQEKYYNLLYVDLNNKKQILINNIVKDEDVLIAPNYYLNYVVNINNENIDSIIITKGYYSNSGETTNLIYRYDAGNYTLN